MATYPEKFGFIGDLRKCVGKTIADVEILKMQYGCTWASAWAVRFTDGNRAFFVGGVGSGVMDPAEEAIMKSHIFTPEETGKYVEDKKRERERHIELDKAEKRRRLKELKMELGEDTE